MSVNFAAVLLLIVALAIHLCIYVVSRTFIGTDKGKSRSNERFKIANLIFSYAGGAGFVICVAFSGISPFFRRDLDIFIFGIALIVISIASLCVTSLLEKRDL